MSDLRATLTSPAFLGWALAWGLASLLVFGLASAIIPNPVFGREIPPEPFSYWVWIASAPLLGIVGATYTAPSPSGPVSLREVPTEPPDRPEEGGMLGMVAGLGAFLAIGCPVCNKIVLLALGTSGALTIWAPLQPIIGVASVVLLAAAVVWRLRVRARGGACST